MNDHNLRTPVKKDGRSLTPQRYPFLKTIQDFAVNHVEIWERLRILKPERAKGAICLLRSKAQRDYKHELR